MKKKLKRPIYPLILTSSLFQLPIFLIILQKKNIKKYLFMMCLLAITSCISITRWTFSSNYTAWKLDSFFAKFSFYFFTFKYFKKTYKNINLILKYMGICVCYISAKVAYDYKIKLWWFLHGMFHVLSVICIFNVLGLTL